MTETTFQDTFSEEIWDSTYRYHQDNTIDDTLRRVAKAIASVEETEELRREWEEKFYDMLTEFKVVPGGRIVANAGTDFKGTSLINCFVSARNKYDIDSIEGISKHLLWQMQTLKSEGGWGENFSYIRPRGSFIHGIGVESPGAVKYMELFDKSSDIITAGSGKKTSNKSAKKKIRKGAQMAVLNCDSPDVIEFITAKQQPGRLQKFNVSVNVYDSFMEQLEYVRNLRELGAIPELIEEASKWDLIFPDTTFEKYKEEWKGDTQEWKKKGYPVVVYNTVNIEWLWNLIMESTYNRAEPGVLFLDRANYYNPLNYKEKIMATNPCLTGETLVYVADGRGNVPIKQLSEEGKDIPVFCYTDKGDVSIRIMRNPRKTGENEKVYKITLDDGNVLRTTRNHKFKLLNGEYKQVKDLVPGDSLKLLTKFEATHTDVIKHYNSNGQDYFWINNGSRKSIAEHTFISAFSNNLETIPPGCVVHHKDYNGKNNNPDNLQIMTKEEHDAYHRENMLGDKNPMRRAQHEWSEEKWELYRQKMSKSTSGSKNGRVYDITNDELSKHVLQLTKTLGYRISNKDWKKYALENGLPSQFSKWRNDHFGGILGLAKWAALELGIEIVDLDPRTQRRILNETKNGYNIKFENGQVIYIKSCEICGTEFETTRREHGICSNLNCASEHASRIQNQPHVQDKRNKTAKLTFDNRRNELREKQADIFNDLKFNLKREPLKKEWQLECRKKDISSEIGRNSSPLKSYQELKEFSLNRNHKIVSIEFDGYESVYNGTVDEFHNFFVGGFEAKTNINKKKYLYFNNLQCGEQTLGPAGICCLSTTNLTQFVNSDRTDFDYDKLGKYVRYLVRFLDNVNSYSSVPLEEYKHSMMYKRRIGCGVMGWGSSLYMMKIRFGSSKALKLQEKLMSFYARECYKASIELAEEKGMFEYCVPEKHAQNPFVKGLNLPEDYMNRLLESGIRNSALLSIQPNGNSSIFANIVSGGCEPLFLHEYIRTCIVTEMPDHIKDVTPKWYEGEWYETEMFKFYKEGDDEMLRGTDQYGVVYKIDKNRGLTKEVLCEDYAVRYLKSIGEWDSTADWAVTTTQLSVQDHLNDLNGFARWIDSAVSKTINLPFEYSFEDFKKVYTDAWKGGYIKGVTTYRSGTMMSVLSAKADAGNGYEEIIQENVKLPDSQPAVLKTIRSEGRKWYLTITMDELNVQPIALFVHTNSPEKNATTHDAVDRLIELAREKGIPEKWIEDSIQKMATDNNTTKIAKAIGLNLRHGVHVKNVVARLGLIDTTVSTFLFQIRKFLSQYIKDGEKVEGAKCENCGSTKIVYSEGCFKCNDCGSSKCG